MRNHPLGGGVLRGSRANEGVEIEPDGTPEVERQIVKQTLGDESQLDVPLIGSEFASDVLATGF